MRLWHRWMAPARPRPQSPAGQAHDGFIDGRSRTGDSQPSGRHRSQSDGFTLLELIVVILLLSILLGFALPAFQAGGVAGSKDGTARELMHAVQKLKMAALSRQSIHRLHLSINENRIWVTRDDTAAETAEAPPAPV